jgi:cystathionine beta-lyase
MSKTAGLNRRAFIRGAGMTALAGAVGTGSIEAAAAVGTPGMKGGKYDFDTVYSRIGTNSSRWDKPATLYPKGQFKYGMGVATMDFEAAPCITDAMAERCKHHNWGYTGNTDSLQEAIAGWHSKRYDLDVDPDSLVIAAGIYPGMIAALRTFSPPGSKVALLSPAYPGFLFHCRHTKVVANESELVFRNGRYEIDWDDLESRMTPDTQAMIVCNPHNPTGNVWTEEELLRIGRLCLENQVIVLSDEIHSDFVRDGHKYVPFAGLPDKDVVNNSVIFNSGSKTFNLAGQKNAYYYSSNQRLIERIKLNHFSAVNTLGNVANEAAYRDGDEWIDQLLPYIHDNHNFMEQFVKKNMPDVGYVKAEGTFLAWLDFSKVMAALGAEEMAAAKNKEPEVFFQDWLVEHSGVLLNAGDAYGKGGAGHMRFNLGSSRIVVEEALEHLAGAIRKV